MKNRGKWIHYIIMNLIKYLTLPTIFTLIRLIASPLVLPMLLVYLLPYDRMAINLGLTLLFMLLSFTDFLDGYLARKYHLTSKLGGSLDHIADKFLTYCAFIALVTIGKIYFFWVILFIGRDFFVMGLRHIALENSFNLPVDYIGKTKTALQMILIAWLIARPITLPSDYTHSMYGFEISLLTITILLTLLSGYHYYLNCVEQFNIHNTQK